jgi:hypothetical protein
VGSGWKKWKTVEAENSIAALMKAEFKEETMHVNSWDDRLGILGGASEFVALTSKEIKGWDPHSKLPEKQ